MAFVRRKIKKAAIPEEFESLSTPENVLVFAQLKGIETMPLDISGLAAELGVVVRYEPMPDDESGSLKKEKKTGAWIMTVNSLHHPHRQRFTISHEIAHRIRHAANQDEFEDKVFFRNGDSNWMEVEANEFAAALLMPEKGFKACVDGGKTKVQELAAYFQVSSMAVRIRAKVLGYKGHNI